MRERFDKIQDPVGNRGFGQADCLMSGLAVFTLKFPSLLQFDQAMRNGKEPTRAQNLRSLFVVRKAPSDTAMSARLDRIDPRPSQKSA